MWSSIAMRRAWTRQSCVPFAWCWSKIGHLQRQCLDTIAVFAWMHQAYSSPSLCLAVRWSIWQQFGLLYVCGPSPTTIPSMSSLASIFSWWLCGQIKPFVSKMILCFDQCSCWKVSGHCYCCLNASMRWRSSSFALWFWNKFQLLNCYGSSCNWGLQTGFTLNDNIYGQGILALKVCVDSTSQFGMFLSCGFLLRAHSPKVVENRNSLQGIGSKCVHWQTRAAAGAFSVSLVMIDLHCWLSTVVCVMQPTTEWIDNLVCNMLKFACNHGS